MNGKLIWGVLLTAFGGFMLLDGRGTGLHAVLLIVGIVLLVLGLQDRKAALAQRSETKPPA